MHADVPRGRVRALFPMEDYGTISTADEGESYFHRNSVLNKNFDAMAIGDKVRFQEEDGSNGPQASTVKVEG